MILPFEDATLLITGGTGSVGKVLVRRILTGEMGVPREIVVFSRDEGKHHVMRNYFRNLSSATDDLTYTDFTNLLTFKVGDVRDYASVTAALRNVDIVINAAALKQVPSCEYAPYEAVKTNVGGTQNIVRSIAEVNRDVETVIGISTDKACKPINVMGMTKALQERILTEANIECPDTRFAGVRYGNVIASRGSVIPLFRDQVLAGGPVTVTTSDMTRFLISLDDAVDTIFAAVTSADPGCLVIPQIPAARIVDVAQAMIGDRKIPTIFTGIRPGEKIHEVLVSEEEGYRTTTDGDYYIIHPDLPELWTRQGTTINREYASNQCVLSRHDVATLLAKSNVLSETPTMVGGEMLA